MIAEQALDHMLSHEERATALRDGINQLRAVAHRFLDCELFGALDELTRVISTLERQHNVFLEAPEIELPLARPGHKGRRVGIDVRPGSVKRARAEAHLSLREVAGKEITAPAIFLIEKGKTRPSMRTLQLIARRTGKPLEFFIAKTPWNQFAVGLDLAAEAQS